MNNPIDFVITWVDGSDKEWLEEKKQFDSSLNITDEICRYRDMGTLKYWFRGVEKFAPWVNKIYFITYGHLPNWLNTKNEKIVIINHKDYIPKEYLPTYNSNVLELNIHRIKELSENFVLFNDDIFILKKCKETDFFKNDLPCEEYAENISMPLDYDEYFSHTALNNVGIINKYYEKKKVMKKHFFKYFNFKYKLNLIRTICLTPWKNFSLIYDPHNATSYKKSYFKRIWELEPKVLNTVSKNRFRNRTDINHYVIRYMQLLDGNFYPRKHGIGKMLNITKNNKQIIDIIENQKYKMVCINDSSKDFDFQKSTNEIVNAFEKILPEKSSFEK